MGGMEWSLFWVDYDNRFVRISGCTLIITIYIYTCV